MPKVMEANSNFCIRNVMKHVEGSGRCMSIAFFTQYLLFDKFIGEHMIVALILMVYMFPEARSKADSNRYQGM